MNFNTSEAGKADASTAGSDRPDANAVASAILLQFPNVRSAQFCVGDRCNLTSAEFVKSPWEQYGENGGRLYIEGTGDDLTSALDQHIDIWQALLRRKPAANCIALCRDAEGVIVSAVASSTDSEMPLELRVLDSGAPTTSKQ